MNKKSVLTGVAIAAIAFGLLVAGCDAINEFLGIGGGDDPDSPPSTPSGPKPVTPDVTITGGVVRYMREDGLNYEVHVFTETDVLAFSDKRESLVADYLIVAGGGGAGGNFNGPDRGGGGGAGGLLCNTLQTLTLEDGFVAVTVGEGGTGGGGSQQGGDGGHSAIGNITVPGGGGGGNAYSASNINGRPGGGGGGAGAGNNYDSGVPGTAVDGGTWGKDGGRGGANDGGGGGGATGAGSNGVGTISGPGAAGGAPWTLDNNLGWGWLASVADGTTEFSRGGDGGGTKANAEGTPGKNYGDGGSGGSNGNATGGAGHSGIVVIRFLRVSTPAEDPVAEGTGETQGS